MRILSALTFALPLSIALAAQSPAAQPNKQWQKAASFIPGTHILVRERGQHTPQPCTLVWIDQNAVACDTFTPTEHRLIYPAASVASIVEAPAAGEGREGCHFVLPLVAASAGALIGGLAFMDAGTKAGFGGAMLGAAFGGSFGAVMSGLAPRPEPQWAFRVPLRASSRIRRF